MRESGVYSWKLQVRVFTSDGEEDEENEPLTLEESGKALVIVNDFVDEEEEVVGITPDEL